MTFFIIQVVKYNDTDRGGFDSDNDTGLCSEHTVYGTNSDGITGFTTQDFHCFQCFRKMSGQYFEMGHGHLKIPYVLTTSLYSDNEGVIHLRM
jgi:hypothetical protein